MDTVVQAVDEEQYYSRPGVVSLSEFYEKTGFLKEMFSVLTEISLICWSRYCKILKLELYVGQNKFLCSRLLFQQGYHKQIGVFTFTACNFDVKKVKNYSM